MRLVSEGQGSMVLRAGCAAGSLAGIGARDRSRIEIGSDKNIIKIMSVMLFVT